MRGGDLLFMWARYYQDTWWRDSPFWVFALRSTTVWETVLTSRAIASSQKNSSCAKQQLFWLENSCPLLCSDNLLCTANNYCLCLRTVVVSKKSCRQLLWGLVSTPYCSSCSCGSVARETTPQHRHAHTVTHRQSIAPRCQSSSIQQISVLRAGYNTPWQRDNTPSHNTTLTEGVFCYATAVAHEQRIYLYDISQNSFNASKNWVITIVSQAQPTGAAAQSAQQHGQHVNIYKKHHRFYM